MTGSSGGSQRWKVVVEVRKKKRRNRVIRNWIIVAGIFAVLGYIGYQMNFG